MPGRKKSGDKNLSQSDLATWKAATGDVKRMPGRTYKAAEKEVAAVPGKSQIRETVMPPGAGPPAKSGPGAGLDRRTDERLRRGQMKIEARLDLHGMSQPEAHAALEAFIRRGHKAGKRCVLVITGKGSRSREEGGVLRKRVPGWLAAPGLAKLILKTHPARQKDGGDGAIYVLLRRQRD